MRQKKQSTQALDAAAGNGLLDRRMILTGGVVAAAGVAMPDKTLGADALAVETWMKTPGSPFVAYGQPSGYANKVVRIFASAPGTTGQSRWPP